MGIFTKLAVGLVVFILVILFAPGIPPDLKFEGFTLEPALLLKGKLAHNSILDKAEEIKLDRQIMGPESVEIRGDELFTGIIGGELVRIKNGKVKTIARIGKKPCEGEWDVLNCGRIAGLRFDSEGKLLIIDIANGIFKVDVDTGSVKPIVLMDQPIDGKRPMFPDDLDVAKDGTIYWSDASTIADARNMILECLAEPSGRLIKTDPKTKKSTVLISDLHFGNGVQLSKNEDFVLISETMRARVWRYHLKGDKKGQKDIFVDRLPGLPDNIRQNGKGGFYIVMAAPRVDSETSLADLLGPLPLARKFIVRIRFITVFILSKIESFFPGPILREWIAYAEQLGPLGDLESLPYKSIIVETDGNGNIIGSLQNERGPITSLSEIRVGKDYSYLGSPSQKKLFRIKNEHLNR